VSPRRWSPTTVTAACKADMHELCDAYNCECHCHGNDFEEDDEA